MHRRSTLKALAALPLVAGASASSAQDLKGDIAILRECLLQLHPGLLRYNTQTQVEQNLDALSASFVAAPDLAQRYLSLSRFLATLKCGHSYANFFNQRREVAAELFDRRTRLPFLFRWIGDEMIVTADHSGTGHLPPGAAVMQINGVPAAQVLRALLPFARADGHNDAKRRSLLGVRNTWRLETFDIFHGLVHGAPAGGVHRLQLRLPSGGERTAEVPAMSLAERHALIPTPPAGEDGAVWQWRIDAHGIAVLTMNGWAIYNSKWDWKRWLEDRLDELQGANGAKGLIVDIRNNEGGLDCGNPIVERFAREASRLDEQRLVRYRKTPEALNRYLDTWDPSFRDWGDQARRIDDRFYTLGADANRALSPRGPRIELPLVVLTSAQNSSATLAFAQRVQASRIGRLVGETTGGNLRGINGGAFFFVRLPASGLEFDLPLIGTFPRTPMPDAGVEPDVKVEVSAADIAAGRDVQMERALAMLRA